MIYVMSDIHGNMRRFNSIMEQIELQPEDTLYILGDVIDRYPDGLRILRKLMAMPNAKILLGNHEYMMLQALGIARGFRDVDPMYYLGLWYRNSGDVTHRYWKHIKKTLRSEIADYLNSLPINIDIGVNGVHYKLVHAAAEETFEGAWDKHRYHDSVEYAVWYRPWLEDLRADDYILVFGHTTTKHFQQGYPMRIFKDNRIIGIDCGSGYPDNPDSKYSKWGRLACLRLDDMKEFYSKEYYDERRETP